MPDFSGAQWRRVFTDLLRLPAELLDDQWCDCPSCGSPGDFKGRQLENLLHLICNNCGGLDGKGGMLSVPQLAERILKLDRTATKVRIAEFLGFQPQQVGATAAAATGKSHVAADWRQELHRLTPLALPLLPCGAGEEKKGPIDPSTGYGLTGWTEAAFTVPQILAMNGVVRSVGTRTGSGLLALDIDGATALELCLAHGCDPQQARTWQVHRDTDPCRLKVLWRLTSEQQQELGELKTKAQTKEPTRADSGKVIDKGEAVELFHQGGSQVLLLGQHVPSGGRYLWPDGCGPEALAPIPPAWWELVLAIAAGELGIKLQAANKVSPRSRSSSTGWRSVVPCPICRRDTTGYCSRNTSSGTIRCFHGNTFSPELSHGGLAKGQKVQGADGVVYGFARSATQRNGDVFSTFVVHKEPRRSSSRRKEPAPPAAKSKDAAVATGYVKPVTLAHHEILSYLPDRLGGQPRLNIRTRDVHLPNRILSGDEAARLYLELSNPQEKWVKEATFDAVQHLANRAQFDPVAEYLEGLEATTVPLPMEEWNRLDLLLFNIDDPIAAAFLPRFFITAVARTFEPGCIGRQWPVLIGEKGIGKSDLPKLLFNIPGLPEGFVDNPGDLQRDGLMKAHRSWCVELAELNGISRRADKEHLKAFLSERTDTYRTPYSRSPASQPRRFVFWGTSNGPPMNEADPRFVCIPLPDRMLPFAAVEAARDALWARALERYRAGICWHTIDDAFKAELKARNEDHTVTDPWADRVTDLLERRRAGGDLPVSIPDLMDELRIDNAQRNNAAAVRLIELAGALGWVKGRRRPTPGADPRLGLWPKDWK